MSHYLIQISFTAEAFANLVKKPENRLESVVPLVTALAAHCWLWLSFGEYDSTAVIEMPDNVSLKAFKMRVMSSGNVSGSRSLLSCFEDGVETVNSRVTLPMRNSTVMLAVPAMLLWP